MFIQRPGDGNLQTHIIHNTKHIWPTTISAEQYLWEQIKKATGWLEDVIMQTAEMNGPPKLWVNDYREEITPGKTQGHE